MKDLQRLISTLFTNLLREGQTLEPFFTFTGQACIGGVMASIIREMTFLAQRAKIIGMRVGGIMVEVSNSEDNDRARRGMRETVRSTAKLTGVASAINYAVTDFFPVGWIE